MDWRTCIRLHSNPAPELRPDNSVITMTLQLSLGRSSELPRRAFVSRRLPMPVLRTPNSYSKIKRIAYTSISSP